MRKRSLHYVAASACAAGLMAMTVATVWAQSDTRPQRQRNPEARQNDGPQRGPGAQMERGRGNPILQGIELTDEQREQVQAMQREARQKNRAWREENSEQIAAARAKVDEARKALEAAEKQMQELLAQSPSSPEKLAAEIRGVLTPEQQAQLDENLKRMREQQGPPPQMGPARRGPGMGPEGRPGEGRGSDGERRFRRGGEGDDDNAPRRPRGPRNAPEADAPSPEA